MDTVLAQQEDMVEELNDLREKGIFSTEEIKQIVVKRTSYEASLIRKVPKKSDFLRYIEYLLALEALRKKRVQRLKLHENSPSISSYCFTRAQYFVYERALKKFQDDVALWVQYINHARREGAVSLAGKVIARAMLLHPHSVPLYVLAASHEMKRGNSSSARTLFQRGLRMNADSVHLWTQYARMELEYIETRRREKDGVDKEADEQDNDEDGDDDDDEMSDEPALDNAAMSELMNGAIVKEVVRGAVKAVPTTELFKSLHDLFTKFPTPLKDSLLGDLHSRMVEALPNNPQAIKLSAEWSISSARQEDETFVDKLRLANEAMVSGMRNSRVEKDEMASVYSGWVEHWVERVTTPELKSYLTRSLHKSIATLPPSRLTATLLAADLRLGISQSTTDKERDKLSHRAAQYLKIMPSSAELWVLRLSLLNSILLEEWKRPWRDARLNARGSLEDVCQVWLWGLQQDVDVSTKEKLWQDVLKGSIQNPARELHPQLLLEYIREFYDTQPSPSSRLPFVTQVMKGYLPTNDCYRSIFDHELTSEDASTELLSTLYDRWRLIDGSQMEAAVLYAQWLLLNGDGRGAKDVVDRARTMLDGEERHHFDALWMSILNGSADDEDEDEEMGEASSSDGDEAVPQKATKLRKVVSDKGMKSKDALPKQADVAFAPSVDYIALDF
ncbi:U3 snoRNP protein [Tulasnella sp. 403]|nr:U3 snoRNP protein [Tulasnella sp. 403]